MSRWRQWILVGALVATSVPGAVWASEADAILKKLVEKGLLTASEAQEVRNEIGGEAKQREETQKTFVKDTAKELLPESSQNWKWNGDFRLRDEYRNQTGSGQDKNRQRIRFRYGFAAKANDQLKFGARFATGSTADPISTNQSFDTSFNHKTLVLDRAFVEYTPEVPGVSTVKLTGGVMGNPFWLVPGQLVWDDDLNFDGAALHLDKQLGLVNLFTTGGVFSLNTNVTESSTLWSLQGGASLQPFRGMEEEVLDHLKVTGALAYHDYVNVGNSKTETSTAITNAGGLKGTTSALQDFNLLNPTFAIESQVAGVPVGAFSDWIHNTAASEGKNGYLFGVKIGKASVPFDLRKGWEVGYYFERLGQDATFGPFTHSDFGNGGTNHRGHAYWLKLAALKNSTIGLAAFNTREAKGTTKNHVDTYQMDWVTIF